MNKRNWAMIAVFAVIVLLVFLVGVSLMGGRGYGGWGMMGPGMMGGRGFAPFGWIGMLLMWLFPLGFGVLVALGIVWLVRAIGQGRSGQQPAAPARTCPNCHRPAQADWRNCPYCGTALE
jgi:uncharacterized membrane protein